MSIQALSAVLDHSQACKGTRLTAISVANHADKFGITWPSIRLTCEEAGLKRRAVQQGIKELRDDLGELVLLVAADGKTHRPPLYWLRLPGLSGEFAPEAGADRYFKAYGEHLRPSAEAIRAATAPGADSAPGGVQSVHPPGAQKEGGRVQKTTPGLYREPSTNRKRTTDVDLPAELFDFWKSQTGRNGSTKLTTGRRRAIAARIAEGYDAELIRRAISNVARSPWHQGHNERRTRYDDLTLICRSGEKLEQFAGMHVPGNGQPAPKAGGDFAAYDRKAVRSG